MLVPGGEGWNGRVLLLLLLVVVPEVGRDVPRLVHRSEHCALHMVT